MSQQTQNPLNVRADLCRLSRFGANISDAHSCFIFLPAVLLGEAGGAASPVDQGILELGGYHSLSDDVLDHCKLLSETGLIGWVAKHGRSIHVSPFEHDSRTLGIYRNDQKLKSFIGIPVTLDFVPESETNLCGVLACDSKKSFAFSKLQGKLLEDLAQEISHDLKLSRACASSQGDRQCWNTFLQRGEQVARSLGQNAVEVLRVRLHNLESLERRSGTGQFVSIIQQIQRLVQQALPPQLPLFRLPNGDMVMLLDAMMASFYENKVISIARHALGEDHGVQVEFIRRSYRTKEFRALSLEGLITQTCSGYTIQLKEQHYEHRRA